MPSMTPSDDNGMAQSTMAQSTGHRRGEAAAAAVVLTILALLAALLPGRRQRQTLIALLLLAGRLWRPGRSRSQSRWIASSPPASTARLCTPTPAARTPFTTCCSARPLTSSAATVLVMAGVVPTTVRTQQLTRMVSAAVRWLGSLRIPSSCSLLLWARRRRPRHSLPDWTTE